MPHLDTAPSFTLLPGRTPLLVSLPHIGTFIPEALRPAYTERALAVEDTDWHLDALYDFAREMGAGLLMPRCSRYVIDLNRPPENTPMYPGANNTELCPTRFFTGDPLYRDGQAPDAAEVQQRVANQRDAGRLAIDQQRMGIEATSKGFDVRQAQRKEAVQSAWEKASPEQRSVMKEMYPDFFGNEDKKKPYSFDVVRGSSDPVTGKREGDYAVVFDPNTGKYRQVQVGQ